MDDSSAKYARFDGPTLNEVRLTKRNVAIFRIDAGLESRRDGTSPRRRDADDRCRKWRAPVPAPKRATREGRPYLSMPAVNVDLVQRADLEAIVRPDDRRRAVLFDHCRPGRAEARLQRVAVKNLRVNPSAGVTHINPACLSGLRFCRRAR